MDVSYSSHFHTSPAELIILLLLILSSLSAQIQDDHQAHERANGPNLGSMIIEERDDEWHAHSELYLSAGYLEWTYWEEQQFDGIV